MLYVKHVLCYICYMLLHVVAVICFYVICCYAMLHVVICYVILYMLLCYVMLFITLSYKQFYNLILLSNLIAVLAKELL